MTLSPGLDEHLTQGQLQSVLWAAANALRGPVDPGDFKAYVLPVLACGRPAQPGTGEMRKRPGADVRLNVQAHVLAVARHCALGQPKPASH